MRNDNLWRLGVVIAVTAFALYYVVPTFHYFLAVSGRVPVAGATAEEQEKNLEAMRANSVPLGLDLQGGVDVLLAIDAGSIKKAKMEGIAENLLSRFRKESPAVDATVNVTSGPATAQTDAAPGDLQIVLTLNKPEQARTVDNILLDMKKNGYFPQYEAGSVKAGEPLPLAVDPQLLTQNLETTVDSAWKVLHERVDKLGVTQPVVVRQGTNRIRVQIPGEKDPQAVVKNIIRPAVLEFRGVHVGDTPQPGRDGEMQFQNDSAEYIDVTTGKPRRPLPPGYEVLPFEERSSSVTPGQPEQPGQTQYILVRKKPEMTGGDIRDAHVSIGQSQLGGQQVAVALEFNSAGAERFAEVTDQYKGKPLAIVLDKRVYSAPNVNEKISGGSAQITGQFSPDEAKNLALVLKAGALPAELRTLDQRTVEATLGADSIEASVKALVIGSALVAIGMTVYYSTAGFISIIAVILNVLLIFAFMKLAGATLTLSGIGGILLTVGMAVDANVLIYERIREELKEGRSIKQAVSLGFSRAFAVIFDANLTTLITGVTLLQFGEGSVKGFALTLNIGILATLFTGLFVTRTLMEFWLNWRGKLSVGRFQWFPEGVYFDFIKLRKASFIFSIITSAAAILYIGIKGPNWGVDFAGGVLNEVVTEKQISSPEVQGEFSDWRVQRVANQAGATGSRFLVRMKQEKGQELAEVRQEIEQRLNKTLGAGQYQIVGSEAVSSEVGKEFQWKGLLATVIASILLLIYIALRFEFNFGVSAVITLVHDVLIAFGLFILLSALGLAGEITLDVVAALLVILGYSVNDTIIIFDRIRENRVLHPGMDEKEMINRSICESLNRNIMTVGTVVVVLIVMLIFGGSGLYDFALVLLLGVVFGTYSSSFVAAPILYELDKRQIRKGRNPARPSTGKPAISSRTQ